MDESHRALCRSATALVYTRDLDRLELAPDDAYHLGVVRRLRIGEVVIASDGAGALRACRVVRGGPGDGVAGRPQSGRRRRERGAISLAPDGPVLFEDAPEPRVVVAFSLVGKDRTEWAVAKLAEAGADEIVPLLCEHTVVRGGDTARRSGRLQLVADESSMQARRVHKATVSEPQDLSSFFAEREKASLCLAEPGGAPPSLERPVVLVGPEGGWSQGELEAANEQAIPLVAIADNVLRVETAALAAAVLLCGLRAGLVSGGSSL